MRCEAAATTTTRAMLGHSQPTAPGTEAKNTADHELTVASSRNSKVWPYVRVPRVSCHESTPFQLEFAVSSS